jgi:hypothetical protein
MAAPSIDSQHVAGAWDADLGGWWARDWTPGPAGTAGLTLAGDVELDVDVASPATLVGLWVPSPLPRRGARALRNLLGDERAAELLALGAGGGPAGPVVLGAGRVRRLGRTRDRSLGRGGVAAPLARLGLTSIPSIAASGDPLVRALGHLDAAAATIAVGPGVGVGAAGRAHALAGIELLVDLARRGELDDRPVDGAALLDALERLDPLLPEGHLPALRAIRADLDAGAVRFAPIPEADPGRALAGGARADVAVDAIASELAMAPPPAAAAPLAEGAPRARVARQRPVGHVVGVDVAVLPLALAAASVRARTTTPSEIEVRVADRGHGGRWWARAFDLDGQVVAAAPLLAGDGDAVARLLVPPERLTQLRVDVTDQPGEPRPSAAALDVLGAVATGQAAARAERLGRTGDAAARWHRAATAWERAGADQRAGLARELAAGRRDERIPPPLLADPLVEALDG